MSSLELLCNLRPYFLNIPYELMLIDDSPLSFIHVYKEHKHSQPSLMYDGENMFVLYI